MMIHNEDVQKLLNYERTTDGRVLTVYLDIDQSHQENLNQGHLVALKNLLKDLELRIAPGEQKAYKASAQRLRETIEGMKPAAKGVVICCNAEADYLWHCLLRFPVENQAHYESRPFVRPLLEARDEFERHAVVLTDRRKSRLFLLHMGHVDEAETISAEQDVHKFDASGSDHLMSQMHFQRKADEHARAHHKEVVDRLDALLIRQPFDRLILGGPVEAVTELEKLLTDQLKRRHIGGITIAVSAPEKEVLEAAQAYAREWERAQEQVLLDQLLTSAAKEQQAITGLDSIVGAVQEGRIHVLVYADDFEASGSECDNCGALVSGNRGKCAHCLGKLSSVEDFLTRLVEKTARNGGAIEQLRDSAAARLRNEGGGIGALLRF